MSVYVDAARHRTGPKGRKKYCHMTADSEEELHAFAAFIGVKRCWFERSRKGVPHYDLDERKRVLALEAGAVDASKKSEWDVEEFVRGCRDDVREF